ncbi:conserved hypothetical protein [Halorhabdus tiamatea SARL4B]|nr:conserved hypothetical protein [Halorhabdus tiamatea SARL4B]
MTEVNTTTDGDTTDGETPADEDMMTSEGKGTATDSESGGTPDTGTETPDGKTSTSTSTAPEALDRRDANVVGVEFESTDSGVSFDVSLNHDDSGEEGYANWWQVEQLDGTQLGRRELLHAHANQPFARSETIEIPEDVSCVVVRGHDQTHGYGGLAMLISLTSGERTSIDQGSEPQSFETNDCP